MEILAPCGGPEHIGVAVNCGADAVYLGAPMLSARRNAANFTPEELAAAVKLCHQNDVKVYLTVNTIVFDSEINELLEILQLAKELSVDAIIVQDWGVADFIREKLPDMPLHASTQTSIHTPAGAVMAKKLGFERVVLARELTGEQIDEIACAGNIEPEMFVHGALCAGVSGQCYFSALLGSRSGNRGLCAQPCRLETKTKNASGLGMLSLKDLSLINRMPELEKLKVVSLKIEGRMKRPEYVAAAVTACRTARAGSTPDLEELAAVYSRNGFTSAYFDGDKQAMSGIRRREDVVSAAPVLGSLRQLALQVTKRRQINICFSLKQDQPALLTVRDGDMVFEISGEIPQNAKNHQTSAQEVQKQLSKLHDTPYEISGFTADIQPGLMLPLSQQNQLRRLMVEKLYAHRLAVNTTVYRETQAAWEPAVVPVTKPARFLRVQCQTWEQWEAADDAGAEASLPLNIAMQRSAESIPQNLFISPPRWMAGREMAIEHDLKQLYDFGVRHLICHNIAHMELARRIGYTMHGGFELNITNRRSFDTLMRHGLADTTLSIELTLKQRITNGVTGRVVYGKLPMMLLTRCPVRDDALRRCDNCPGLTDRTGRHLALRCDGHYAELLNPDTLWMADRLNEVHDDFLVLLLDNESREETLRLIDSYKKGGQPTTAHTRGLLYRGVN